MEDKILRRIQALLAKAEHAGTTQEEADACSAKAEKLIVSYSIDRALVDARLGKEQREQPTTEDLTILAPYLAAKWELLEAVAQAHDVKNIRRGGRSDSTQSVITVVGYPSDIESVKLLWASLSVQQLTSASRVSDELKGRNGARTTSLRNSFYFGFAIEVRDRLRAIRATAEKAAESASPGTALVLVDRSTLVRQHYTELFPNIKMIPAVQPRSNAGYALGKSAGRTANIGQTGLGGGRQALGR